SDRLRYAFEAMSMSRIRHQVIDINSEQAPDNNIEPEMVSATERHTLKDAFQVLSHAQKFLRFRYPMSSR
ncbi:MAG TPA: putative nucleotidyltransferase substrate binding domain-containing protein, partial [Halomonas sp.]|nr:putative nucleotidyltransferase substrate binding domain-containing protein [Halomonas sp.]